MAISRAFTRNLGAPIPGTVQVGDIAYTLPGTTIDFAATGLKWYNGPDEADIVTGNGIAGDFAGARHSRKRRRSARNHAFGAPHGTSHGVVQRALRAGGSP